MSIRLPTRGGILFVCLVFLLLPASAFPARKLTPAQRKALQEQKLKDQSPNPTPASPSSSAIIRSLSDALNQLPVPGADYVPCRFTYAELKSLTVPEDVLTLSPADAEALAERVTSVIAEQEAAGLIGPEMQKELFL